MKILIDFVTTLDSSSEKYRLAITQAIVNAINGNLEVVVLYGKNKPKIKGNYASVKLKNFGVFSKRAFASKCLSLQPDAIFSFGAISSIAASNFLTFLYIDETSFVFKGQNKRKVLRNSKLFNRYERVIVQTNFYKVFLSNNYGIEKERIVVVKPGYEVQFLSENITDDIRDARRILTIYRISKPYLFTFGKVEEYAHIETVIEAFSQIHLKYPDLKLLIASPDFKIGWDNKPVPLTKRAASVFELASQYKVARKVLFAGIIDRKHLPVILSNAEICLNLDSRDKFSYSVLETLATQSALIIGDSPVLKEIAGSAAIVASSTVPSLLAEKLNFVLSEEKERQKLTKKAKERLKEFRWEDSARTLVESMKEANQNKPKSKLMILYTLEERIKELTDVLDNKFEIKTAQAFINHASWKEKIKYLIAALRLLGKHNRVIVQQENLNKFFIVMILPFRLFFPRTRWFLFLSPQFFTVNKQGIKARVFAFVKRVINMVYFKLMYGSYIVTNPVFEEILSQSYKLPREIIYLVEPAVVPLPTGINLSRWKEDNKLKNYVGILTRVASQRESELVQELFEKLTELNTQFKLFLRIVGDKQYSVDIPSKRFTIVSDEDEIAALSGARIYLDFRGNLSVEDLLLAMKTKNLCVVSENYSSEYMVKEGINGYIVNPSETDKIVKLLNKLINNKKHLSDIQKINYLKTLDYEKSSIIERTSLFLNDW